MSETLTDTYILVPNTAINYAKCVVRRVSSFVTEAFSVEVKQVEPVDLDDGDGEVALGTERRVVERGARLRLAVGQGRVEVNAGSVAEKKNIKKNDFDDLSGQVHLKLPHAHDHSNMRNPEKCVSTLNP